MKIDSANFGQHKMQRLEITNRGKEDTDGIFGTGSKSVPADGLSIASAET